MRAYTAKEVDSGVWKRKDPNQTVSTGVNQYDPNTPSNAQIDTTAPQNWTTFQGSGFTMQVPSNWQAAGTQGSAMVAPPGGITQAANSQAGNLVYGVLTDTFRPEQAASSTEMFNELIAELTRENPGLEPGPAGRIRVGDVSAESVQSTNRSANNGRGEHDWIVALPQNGAMRYFVFVSPQADFEKMRLTFERIVNSIRLE
jgi:hypothetical protein